MPLYFFAPNYACSALQKSASPIFSALHAIREAQAADGDAKTTDVPYDVQPVQSALQRNRREPQASRLGEIEGLLPDADSHA
jgi:hypothetical protein